MVNRHRGEIEAALDGKSYRLCLTLGALAELEYAFGEEDMLAVAERFESGRIAAKDAIRIIGAGLRGAGYELDDATVAGMKCESARQASSTSSRDCWRRPSRAARGRGAALSRRERGRPPPRLSGERDALRPPPRPSPLQGEGESRAALSVGGGDGGGARHSAPGAKNFLGDDAARARCRTQRRIRTCDKARANDSR